MFQHYVLPSYALTCSLLTEAAPDGTAHGCAATAVLPWRSALRHEKLSPARCLAVPGCGGPLVCARARVAARDLSAHPSARRRRATPLAAISRSPPTRQREDRSTALEQAGIPRNPGDGS